MVTCVVGKVLLLLITIAFIIFHVVVQSIAQFISVAQSCPTLRPHESQHARPPCPSPTLRVYSNDKSCPTLCDLVLNYLREFAQTHVH